jgi:hypothetical protein
MTRKEQIENLGNLFLLPLTDEEFERVLKQRGRLIQEEIDGVEDDENY